MATETKPAPQWIPILVALILGIAIGHFARPGRSHRGENGSTRLLTVNQSATVGPPADALHPEPIYLHKGDTADWTLIDTTGHDDALRTLYIDVDDPQLFPKSKQVPGTKPAHYRIPCVGPYCLSGPVGDYAIIGHTYTYWQTVLDASGKPEAVDGHIIIKQWP